MILIDFVLFCFETCLVYWVLKACDLFPLSLKYANSGGLGTTLWETLFLGFIKSIVLNIWSSLPLKFGENRGPISVENTCILTHSLHTILRGSHLIIERTLWEGRVEMCEFQIICSQVNLELTKTVLNLYSSVPFLTVFLIIVGNLQKH